MTSISDPPGIIAMAGGQIQGIEFPLKYVV